MFNTQKPSENDLPSSSQLFKSTIIALAVAGALLLCVVIPAEYGKDPTGVGELLGLKKMGEIKFRLEKESLNENQVFNENISFKDEVREDTETTEENHDVLEFILEPDEAIEIKLEMIEGSLDDAFYSLPEYNANTDSRDYIDSARNELYSLKEDIEKSKKKT